MTNGGPLGSVLEAIEHLNTLLSHETQAALVRKDGRLAGIVTRYDVLRHVAGIQ